MGISFTENRDLRFFVNGKYYLLDRVIGSALYVYAWVRLTCITPACTILRQVKSKFFVPCLKEQCKASYTEETATHKFRLKKNDDTGIIFLSPALLPSLSGEELGSKQYTIIVIFSV